MNMFSRPIWAVSLEIETKRYDICKTCENFNLHIKTCKLCSCFIPIKIIMPGSVSCPIKKW